MIKAVCFGTRALTSFTSLMGEVLRARYWTAISKMCRSAGAGLLAYRVAVSASSQCPDPPGRLRSPGDVALEAAVDFGIGLAFCAASGDIGPGSLACAPASQEYVMQGAVEVAVAAAVEPVTDDAAAAGGECGVCGIVPAAARDGDELAVDLVKRSVKMSPVAERSVPRRRSRRRDLGQGRGNPFQRFAVAWATRPVPLPAAPMTRPPLPSSARRAAAQV
jgi:hypothetical protein